MAKKKEAPKPEPTMTERDEAMEILREIARHSEDDQARALAAIGWAQLVHTVH